MGKLNDLGCGLRSGIASACFDSVVATQPSSITRGSEPNTPDAFASNPKAA